jgi:hypothetical protein
VIAAETVAINRLYEATGFRGFNAEWTEAGPGREAGCQKNFGSIPEK